MEPTKDPEPPKIVA